jgi:hypothetical protein
VRPQTGNGALYLLDKSAMPAIPALVFLAAALLCSFIGRVLLITTAFGVSTGWGFTVLLVPFGPLFFRLNYRELAYPTRYWRMVTGPLMLLFFLNGGTTSTTTSFRSLANFGKAMPAIALAGDTHFHLPVPSKIVAAAMGQKDPTTDPAPATPAATAPAATPSKAVAAAASAMPAAPKILSPAERVDANRQEFERLAVWYDNLKHERGYLRKGDTAAVEAFNAEAAKYQAALQLAKNEQAELTKLTAKK